MRRLLVALCFLALVLAACDATGGGETTTAAVADPTTTTQGSSGEDDGEGTTSTSSPDPNGTTSDRPVAPDFTLTLGEGGVYALSEGAKPVYLVFWAEW